VDIFGVESAAYGEHGDRAVSREVYPEHRLACAGRNDRSKLKT
jgi:hypothetical protein